MATLEWGKIALNSKAGKSGGKGKYLSLKSGEAYQVRLLGNPVKFFKYLIQDPSGSWRTAITDDPEGSEIAKAKNLTARERYAINVIDRSDGGLKILEGPISVFREFEKYWEITGQNPGGPNGGDFKITVEGAGLKTRYNVKFLKRTPLTDEERELIRSKKMHNLETEFAPQSENEIKQRLFDDIKKTSEETSEKSNVENDLISPPECVDNDDALGESVDGDENEMNF